MIRLVAALAALLLLATPIYAKTWGPASVAREGFDRKAELDRVFRELAEAPNEVVSRLIADEMWLIFMQAPDAQAAEDLNRALRARGGYNFEKAKGILDGMIERHPDYPEGWNQRAYINFLLKDYDASLSDCERALELEPRHLGCISGMARILIRHKKDYKAGETLLKKAMDMHPWIHERVLINELPPTENL